jgi:phage terminase large subunit-like protein
MQRVRLPSWELGECPIPRGCRFEPAAADHACRFIERFLTHTKGEWSGTPFILAPWQRRDIREIFGRVYDDGRRVIRQVYVEIPKKNGKSELAAAIALYMLFADGEAEPEVYGAAADLQQASIVWGVAARMVLNSPHLKRLTGGGRYVLESGKRIKVPSTGGVYRALTAEVAGKHGYNASCVVFDEVHCQKDFRLWEVLTVGAGAARRQPLTYAITTAGIIGESPVAEMLHREAVDILRGVVPCPEWFYPVVYAAPEDADWTDEGVWRAVNPALGDEDEIKPGGAFVRIEALRREFEAARMRPALEGAFRRLHLNQWVRNDERWIRAEDWDACTGTLDLAAARDWVWWGGLDLSSRVDLTALVLAARDGAGVWWLMPYVWLPEGAIERSRLAVERERYREWCKRGLVTVCPGDVVDYAMVARRVRELADQYRIAAIAYDPMFAGQLAQELSAVGVRMVEWKQTYQRYTEAMNSFESLVRTGMLRHPGHAVLSWCVDCLRIKQREDGGVRPVKPDRRASTARIDAAVAAIMAVGLGTERSAEAVSIYELGAGV